MGRVAALALGAGVMLAADAAPARAGHVSSPVFATAQAPADSDTLSRFLGGLSDSTDRYFGISAARPDTAGHDSLLVYSLAHPERTFGRRTRPSFRPDFAFNRVDGPVWGAVSSMGQPRQLGQVIGRIGYAAGPNVWLGGGEYVKTLRRHDAVWALRVLGGRETEAMDRDHPGRLLPSLQALVNGNDYRRFHRRDGWQARLEREASLWRVGAGYRDMLESALETTTTWNLTDKQPVVIDNTPATFGRVHEIELEAAVRPPWLPVTAEVIHQTSGRAIGSDFEYRRTYAAASADIGLGGVASVLPQIAYGKFSGTLIPQAAFYLGGPQTLRSVPGVGVGGSGMTLARLDVIETPDLLELAHIPHPAAFPLQAGVFAAAGAVWGTDPYGGPTVPGVDWPHAQAWLSEVGASLIYQPGFPDPTGLMRLNVSWPLGPEREYLRFTVSYSRALDLVRPLGD